MVMKSESSNKHPQQHAPTIAERRKVLGASLVGTGIEWYDFFIYGSAAALIFGPQFFPSEDPLTGTLAAFATFAVGFIARPIGGLVMGHYGDRVGRKQMLLLSMLMMGGATVAIGFLPNYATVGVWAPILLVTLRFIQGLGVGGEWGGAVIMAVEYAPKRSRALYGAFPQMGLPIGIIVSNLVFILVTNIFAVEFFAAWGWRIPFLISGLLIGVALYIRFQIEESPVFESTRKEQGVVRNPLGELMRKHKRSTILAGLISIACPAIGYIYSVYLLSYGTAQLGLSSNTMLGVILIGACVHLATVYLGAVLADRFTQKKVFITGATMVTVWAFPFFILIDSGDPVLITLSVGVMLLAQSLMAGPQAALIAELFPANVRYSGASVSYQIGSILGGGFVPLIAVSLYAAFGSSTPISVYLLVLGVISLLGIIALRPGRYSAPDVDEN